MKLLLFASASLAALALSTVEGSAITITFYEDTYINTAGGQTPIITNNLTPQTLTIGVRQTFNLFTVTPTGSCNSSCLTDQGDAYSLDEARIFVSLVIVGDDGVEADTATAAGYYEAKYFGTPLACDTVSSGSQSGCIDWTDFGNTTHYETGTGFHNGDLTSRITVTFNRASGWGITPTITVLAEQVATSPLPGTFPFLATGLGVMGLLGWRRKRNAADAIAAD
jgi:hypothetical protein